MPLAMMKHLEEDVPPVFMILDTYDKDVKVDNVLNRDVEPLFFCIRFLNTTYFMFSSVSLVNTFLSRLRCLLIYLWHLYIQLFLPHFSSGFRMNFVSFPDIFFPARTFFLAPISSVYMETIGSSLSGTLLNLHPPLLGPVRYTLRCLVAVPQDTDCVTTIKSTEEKLANKKKELETFQVLHVKIC